MPTRLVATVLTENQCRQEPSAVNRECKVLEQHLNPLSWRYAPMGWHLMKVRKMI